MRFAIAVCSFGNDHVGGFVYLGIRFDGNIMGLERDKKIGNFRDYDDSFANHIRDKLEKFLHDKVFITSKIAIKFRRIDNKTICLIHVLPSKQPLFLDNGKEKEFYVRGPTPRAEKLEGTDQFRYIRDRFPEYK